MWGLGFRDYIGSRDNGESNLETGSVQGLMASLSPKPLDP